MGVKKCTRRVRIGSFIDGNDDKFRVRFVEGASEGILCLRSDEEPRLRNLG